MSTSELGDNEWLDSESFYKGQFANLIQKSRVR